MSAAGLANLRSRISSKFSSSAAAPAEPGQEAPESSAAGGFPGPADDVPGRVEPLSARVGASTRVSVQRRAGGGGDQILAGVFPETALLTIHNTELEVLPQSAYKLPRGTESVALLGERVMLASASSRSDTSARCRQGHLQVVSVQHAELHLVRPADVRILVLASVGPAIFQDAASGRESVFQSFSLGSRESVLGLVRCGRRCQDLEKEHSRAEEEKKSTSQQDEG